MRNWFVIPLFVFVIGCGGRGGDGTATAAVKFKFQPLDDLRGTPSSQLTNISLCDQNHRLIFRMKPDKSSEVVWIYKEQVWGVFPDTDGAPGGFITNLGTAWHEGRLREQEEPTGGGNSTYAGTPVDFNDEEILLCRPEPGPFFKAGPAPTVGGVFYYSQFFGADTATLISIEPKATQGIGAWCIGWTTSASTGTKKRWIQTRPDYPWMNVNFGTRFEIRVFEEGSAVDDIQVADIANHELSCGSARMNNQIYPVVWISNKPKINESLPNTMWTQVIDENFLYGKQGAGATPVWDDPNAIDILYRNGTVYKLRDFAPGIDLGKFITGNARGWVMFEKGMLVPEE